VGVYKGRQIRRKVGKWGTSVRKRFGGGIDEGSERRCGAGSERRCGRLAVSPGVDTGSVRLEAIVSDMLPLGGSV
jgi:hypothetical protein